MKVQVIRVIFLFSFLVLLLHGATPLEISSGLARWIFLGLSLAAGMLLVRPSLRQKPWQTLAITFFFTLLVRLLFSLYSWGGDWKTRTVLYQHNESSLRTIDFQFQDVGARGYNRRVVERVHILPLLYWVCPSPQQGLDTTKWRKVDKDLNEIGFKGG